jgi:ATP-dependent Zn protease
VLIANRSGFGMIFDLLVGHCLQVELMEVVDFFRKPEKFRASGEALLLDYQ